MAFWKKSISTRFGDTIRFIQSLADPAMEGGAEAASLRAQALDGANQVKLVDQVMSLGLRWELSKSAAETRRRQYIRAVLLGYATLGDPAQDGRQLTVDETAAKKTATAALTENQLDTLLTNMVRQAVKSEGKRTFVGMRTTLEKQNAVWALNQIAEAITKVQQKLGVISNNATEATRFATWFGASSHQTVRTNYGKIYTGVQGGIMLIKDESEDAVAYVYKDGPNNPPRVYLCNGFWNAGKLSWTNAGGRIIQKDSRQTNDNPLGAIIHELSHIFVDTEDYVYNQTNCKQLALNSPHQATMNADNYEYYAESVMLSPNG